MKRGIFIACIVVVSFVIGAVSMYFVDRPRNSPWLYVSSDGAGLSFEIRGFNPDIPMPKSSKPKGRVKFLNRDSGEVLGYAIELPIKDNPTASLPEKYRLTTKLENGLEIGPPDQVGYTGHFEFTLKDSDGFVLKRISSPSEHLSAGAVNSVQGSSEETVPRSVITRTKAVDVRFVVESCDPCDTK